MNSWRFVVKPFFATSDTPQTWAVWLIETTCVGDHGRVVEVDIRTRKLARERAKKWTAQRKVCETPL